MCVEVEYVEVVGGYAKKKHQKKNAVKVFTPHPLPRARSLVCVCACGWRWGVHAYMYMA